MPKYIGYNFTGTANSTVVTPALNGGVTDSKYNSGVWTINGSDKSSVYGRRRQGNWLTSPRGNAVIGWVKIVLLGESETFSPGASVPSLAYMQGGTTEYVMDLNNIADQTLSIKTTPRSAGGPGRKVGGTGGRGIILATSAVPTPGAFVPITFQPNLLAVAGGSGGEGGTVSGAENSFTSSTGGSGGGPVGQTQPGGAGGGTQSAGGTGSPGTTPGSPGGYLVGGAGGSGYPGPNSPEGPKGGGGGGGGYFGGGGGGGRADAGTGPFNGKGGGGGSGFANTTHPYHYSSSTVQGRTRYSPIYSLGPGNANGAVFVQFNESISELDANTQPYTNLNISNDTAHTITFNPDGTYNFV